MLIGICNRKGICGPQTAECNETSTDLTENKAYFSCNCPSNLVLIGEKCPEDTTTEDTTTEDTTTATTVFISNATTVPNPSTSSTKRSTTSSMQTGTICDSSSHLFVEPMLIILLNLVYFFNK